MTHHWLGTRAARYAAGVFLLLLNTAYLAAFATPSLFYYSNVVLHIALGVLLAVLLAREFVRARRDIPMWLQLAAAVLAAGTAVGGAIAVVGAAGPLRWLLPVHITLMLAGLVPWLMWGAWVAGRRVASPQRVALGRPEPRLLPGGADPRARAQGVAGHPPVRGGGA